MRKKFWGLLFVLVLIVILPRFMPPEYSLANIVASKTLKCPSPKNGHPDLSYAVLDKKLSIPVDYVPSNLVVVPKKVTNYVSICLKEDPANMLKEMIEDAKKQNLKLAVTSGYRGAMEQRDLYSYWISMEGRKAEDEIARPGFSEHQLGISVDVTGASIKYSAVDPNFAVSREYIWLADNAHKYGFILSYPPGKKDITGYNYEPWHYRFVGLEIAEQAKLKGYTWKEIMKEKNPTLFQ